MIMWYKELTEKQIEESMDRIKSKYPEIEETNKILTNKRVEMLKTLV